MVRLLALVFAASLAAACGGNPPPPAPPPTPVPTTGGDGAAPAEVPPPPFDLAQLGAPCGEGDGNGNRCPAAGTTCVKYYGIAGPRGPEFSSCEIPCADDKSVCPAGSRCVTVADGPGAVCRPEQPVDHPPVLQNQ